MRAVLVMKAALFFVATLADVIVFSPVVSRAVSLLGVKVAEG